MEIGDAGPDEGFFRFVAHSFEHIGQEPDTGLVGFFNGAARFWGGSRPVPYGGIIGRVECLLFEVHAHDGVQLILAVRPGVLHRIKKGPGVGDLPVIQKGVQQFLPALEEPVKSAPGHAELVGEPLHLDRIDA